jgi:hypothetical protein
MLISHEHKFIFIKVRKTAGTSVEVSLSRFLTHRDDVITPISAIDEAMRLRETGVQPRNFETVSGSTTKQLFWNHCPILHVRSHPESGLLKNYFTFCFERNPWDKVVSMYWLDRAWNRIRPDLSFDAYVREHAMKVKDWHLYTDGKAPIVDFVGQYERLLPDLTRICEQLRIPFDGWLPRAKGECRRDTRSYREYYSDEGRSFVEHVFRDEIVTFGYRFD